MHNNSRTTIVTLVTLAFFILKVSAQPKVNYTLSYPDGSSLRAELVSADGSLVRVVVIPPGANENFLRYELRVPQPDLPPTAGFNIEDHPSYVLLSTTNSILNVSKNEPTSSLMRPDGTLLSYETQPISREDESQCGNGHGGPIVGGCLRSWRSLQRSSSGDDEAIYGFGMQSYTVNHVGTTKWIQTDANPSVNGLDHAPAPFFLSSLGYGVVLNTHSYSYFDVGFAFPITSTGGINLMHSSDPVVDIFFLVGPHLTDVMAQFTQLFGRTSLPPKFSLGLWYHPLESSNQTHVEDVVSAFASNEVALSAITLEPPWQTHSYSCTYVINNNTFWNFTSFMSIMNASNTKVSLWQHSYIYNESQGLLSPLWKPVFDGGLASDWITWGGATPDWTLSQTRNVVGSYMTENFINVGIAAFKLDECDGNAGQTWFFPDNSSWPSGFSGSQMHNLFGATYSFTYHELFESLGQRTFLKARAGYMGSGRYPTTMYSDSYDYNQYILAVANSGFISLAWAPELRDASSDSEFARRSQLMLLSGLASEDAWNTGFMPFEPSVNSSSASIFKTFYDARTELIPALYSSYQRQSAQGLPALRHPVIDFDSDTNLRNILDEFMFTDLLVAPGPIGEAYRSVYFPKSSNNWVSYWNPSGNVYNAGQTYNISCPDSVLPVYQQVGTIIQLANITDKTILRLRGVVSTNFLPSSYRIYDDDGESLKYRNGEFFSAKASLLPVYVSSRNEGSVQVQIEVNHVNWQTSWRIVQWELAYPGGVSRVSKSQVDVSCLRNADEGTRREIIENVIVLTEGEITIVQVSLLRKSKSSIEISTISCNISLLHT
jgi:alpha-D-xyloside xylohydrolase